MHGRKGGGVVVCSLVLWPLFYITTEASLSLTDVSQIPDDAELAETFYSQFEDEFENDDSEDEMEDEDDLTALMGQMKDALEQTESRDQTLGEADLPSEGLSDTWRHKRIQGLRAYPYNCSYITPPLPPSP